MNRFLSVVLAALVLLPLRAHADETQRPRLELSLEEAVKRALENNVDLQVQRFTPQFTEAAVKAATGYYDPQAFSQINDNSTTTPQTSFFSGGTQVTTKTFNYNFGVTQYVPTGASVTIAFSNTRTSSNSVFVLFNPNYASTLSVSLTQPLLKNRSLDYNREQLKIAKKNKEISDVQFQQSVVNTVAVVKGIYYDFLSALDNLDAANKSLGLARKLLEENKIKVRVGTLAPLDVVQAESEVASRELDVINAESTITNTEDNLKAAIFPKDDPKAWELQIVPTDKATPTLAHIDLDSALKTAMEKRTDLMAARKQVELYGIGVEYARSQTLPQLDLVGSYGTQGVGGTQNVRQSLGGPITQIIPGGYGDDLSQVFSTQFPTWKVGVNVTYPIGNRAASGAFSQARVNESQARAVLQRLELEVATEVRSAGRAVETNIKRVEAARAARVLQEQRLDAEEKKFAAGMSTNFLVTQAQRDLATAEVTEIQAVDDFNKSVVNFERTQVAGPGTLTTLAYSTPLSGQSTIVSGSTTTGTTATGTTATTTTGTVGTTSSAVPATPALTTVQGKRKPNP